MPSDVKKLGEGAQVNSARDAASEPIEPPSVKLLVRLFLIPLIIVALAVGVMFLIGLMAGSEPSFEEALQRLRAPGGQRTASYLVGPASKQRYLDAKAVADKMKAPEGLSEAEWQHLGDISVEQLKARILMRNAQFSYPLDEKRVKEIFAGTCAPLAFDYEKAKLAA